MSWMQAIIRVDPEPSSSRTWNSAAPDQVASRPPSSRATIRGEKSAPIDTRRQTQRTPPSVAASLVTEADERVVLSLSAVVPGDTTELAVGDALVPLPSLDFDTSLSLSLLVRVDAGGAAVEARVLGAGLPNANMSSDGLSLLVAATYHCNMDAPVVFDDMGVGTSLPSACDQLDPKAYRGFVMSVPL